jgi:hypothetical protein
MNWGLVLFFGIAAIAAVLALWAVVAPRSQWRAMQSWAFRNPEANEPSDAAYALTRLGGVVVLVLLGVGVVGLVSTIS